MAVEAPELLLPPELLTADDVLVGFKTPFEKPGMKMKSDELDMCFPAEFPYDLCSDSAETESDEDEFLTGLTRRLARSLSGQNNFEKWGISGSPQSTLARVGSGSGLSSGSSNGPSQISSPTTPLGAMNDSWELILQAAGEVARLKLSAGDEPLKSHCVPIHRSFAPPFSPVSSHHVHNGLLHRARVEQMVKQQQSCGIWDNGCYIEPPRLSQVQPSRAMLDGVGLYAGRPMMGAARPTATALHFQHQNHCGARLGMPFGGSVAAVGVKRERAGTGVFLPRRYGDENNHNAASSESKTGCSATARVVQGLHKNMNFEDINGSFHPRFNGVTISDYDMLVARRNAAAAAVAAKLAQQRRNISHEVCLPQEWTY